MSTYLSHPLPDVQSWLLFSNKNGVAHYLVGSISADRYLVVDEHRHPLVMQIIHQLQQGDSTETIQDALAQKGIRTDIEAFIAQLDRHGLLEAKAEVADEETKKRPFYSQLKVLSWDVFSIPLDAFWSRMIKAGRYFRILLLSLAMITSLLVLGNILWGTQRFSLSRLLQMRDHLSLPLFILTYLSIPLFIIPLHELSHALFATEKGVFPKQLTFRLYMMILPFFSLQLPGLYTLPLKHRLWTIAAGPMMNLTLGNLALLISLPSLAHPAPWQAFLLVFAAINYATFLFNLTPFLPLDGYYLLSQWGFKELDIRSNAWASFRRWLRKRNAFPPISHLILVITDSLFLITLLYLGVGQLNHYLLRWSHETGARFINQLNPHLLTPLLILVDTAIVLFAIYRLSTLMGIRKALQKAS